MNQNYGDRSSGLFSSQSLKIGMVGLDTSHCEIFTKLLNDTTDPYHVSGGQLTHAIPAFSPDLPLSHNRVGQYRDIVTRKYEVLLTEDLEEMMSAVDAVLLTTVDGRNHLKWYRKLVSYQKPIFIDKPIVLSSAEMDEVIRLANEYGTPTFSSSSLRFAEAVVKAEGLEFERGYLYGPLPLQDAMPGYFWYGIHLLEMMVTLFGLDVKGLHRETRENYEQLFISFTNGREVILQADYEWHARFGAVLHTKDDTCSIELWKEEKPYYASLLENIVNFFQTGCPPVTLQETAGIIKLIEEINGLTK
ncbi:Gfo/Idh/MocA family oxidoreductase [Neobacillus sp. Marseille-QA0830]